jgi:hypothetical protein
MFTQKGREEKMNMDIVASKVGLESQLVRYGEPSAGLVYEAIFGKKANPNIDLRRLKSVIEELDEEQWELLSLEYGEEQQPASFWLCSDYITEIPVEILHEHLETLIAYLRSECIKLKIAPAA